jgi:hypothetical protein
LKLKAAGRLIDQGVHVEKINGRGPLSRLFSKDAVKAVADADPENH